MFISNHVISPLMEHTTTKKKLANRAGSRQLQYQTSYTRCIQFTTLLADNFHSQTHQMQKVEELKSNCVCKLLLLFTKVQCNNSLLPWGLFS